MKFIKRGIAAIGAFLIITSVSAQKVLHDATLTYAISVQSTDGKTDLSKSLEGAVLTVYLKGVQSRSEMVSTLGSEANVFDGKSGKGFILKEYSGQKLMITMDRNNWNQKNQFYQSAVFKIENTEQTINGFRTKKAISTLPDGKAFTVNFSSEFIPGNKQYNNAFAQLEGLPVQYEIISGNLKFTYTLLKVDQDIIASGKFEAPKTGFRVMTYEENQQLKRGDSK